MNSNLIKFKIEQDLYKVKLPSLSENRPSEFPAFIYQFLTDDEFTSQVVYKSSFSPSMGYFLYFHWFKKGESYLVPAEIISKRYTLFETETNSFLFMKDDIIIDKKYIFDKEFIGYNDILNSDVPKTSAKVSLEEDVLPKLGNETLSINEKVYSVLEDKMPPIGNDRTRINIMNNMLSISDTPRLSHITITEKLSQTYEKLKVSILNLLSKYLTESHTWYRISLAELDVKDSGIELDILFGRRISMVKYVTVFAVHLPVFSNYEQYEKVISSIENDPVESLIKLRNDLVQNSKQTGFLFQCLAGALQRTFLICLVFLSVSSMHILKRDIPKSLEGYNIFGDQPKYEYFSRLDTHFELKRKTYVNNLQVQIFPELI